MAGVHLVLSQRARSTCLSGMLIEPFLPDSCSLCTIRGAQTKCMQASWTAERHGPVGGWSSRGWNAMQRDGLHWHWELPGVTQGMTLDCRHA